VQSNIYSCGSKTPILLKESFHATVESQDRITEAQIFVAEGNSGSLLSYKTASELGLIKIRLDAVSQDDTITIESLEAKHPELFSGIGMLKNYEIKLHIDHSVRPVAQLHRRIPFHLRKKVEDELKLLLEQDIIEKVSGPTPWISPIVTPPKPNQPEKVRLCIDMRQANQAIIRERHVMPTLDDVINDLNGSVKFSRMDLTKSYHQLVVEESCRYITTFSTHVGLFRFKRLNFPISSASEIFQNTMAQILRGIPSVKTFLMTLLCMEHLQKRTTTARELLLSGY